MCDRTRWSADRLAAAAWSPSHRGVLSFLAALFLLAAGLRPIHVEATAPDAARVHQVAALAPLPEFGVAEHLEDRDDQLAPIARTDSTLVAIEIAESDEHLLAPTLIRWSRALSLTRATGPPIGPDPILDSYWVLSASPRAPPLSATRSVAVVEGRA